jgi:hypothetical protein
MAQLPQLWLSPISEPEFRDSPKTVEKVESAVFGELPAGSRHREHEKEDGGVLFC